MRLVYITLARKILCYGSFSAKVLLGTNAYNSLNCYSKEIKITQDSAKLYLWRGIVYYVKEDYQNAIDDFGAAIQIDPNYELAFYNRGNVWITMKDYDSAIADFNTAISFNSEYADRYYTARGNIKNAEGKYEEAILDYTQAICKNNDYENAYYRRGLAYYKKALKDKIGNIIEILQESKRDFEKYLKLTTGENDNGSMYAKQYIEELNVVIQDFPLWYIKRLINEIKDTLRIEQDEFITHYTSSSTLKNLLLYDSKFRLYEGNFMNDTSEGIEFYNFLYGCGVTSRYNSISAESFSSKPFIGSFVPKDKHDDLNMWRFYGKEKGEEAKGCTITLYRKKFIDDIEDILSDEKHKGARINDESDINFYRVVYFVLHNGKYAFYIPNLDKKDRKLKKLTELMNGLKSRVKPYIKVGSYKKYSRVFLERYLNSIAFLFKNAAYKNEEEVRLVMNGIEFKKEYDMGMNPPKVYIELVLIKNLVSLISFGPKVDGINEWKAAFYYSYEKMDVPEIEKSQVPFK